ncbi:hypothetical protein NMG60_11016602 [Bertholletia excelsa]
MLVSAVFGSRMAVLPNSCSLISGGIGGGAGGGATQAVPRVEGNSLVIECSSRPQKKATKHHMKTRPRKTQPWDIRRKPTVYPPLPPLPPDWTFVTDDAVVPPPPPANK